MRRAGRRIALLAAAALALAAAGGGQASGATSRSSCHRDAPPIIRDGFPEPPMRYSRNGVLDTTLRASVGPVQIDHRRAITMNYDGSYPGPALVICAGDKLVIHYINDLPEPTNLHTHGLHVSPSGDHDNVFLRIQPGRSFTYRYQIPRNNPAGDYWYHPHLHMHVEPQVYAGLAGPIVQEGGIDRLPTLRHIPQRWMFIQSTEIRNGRAVPVEKSVEADTPLRVNGVVDPTVKIRPGQIQRWRLFNANDNRIVVLRLAGQPFRVLAEDGNPLPRMRTVRNLLIGPGSRRDVLVRGGRPGRYAMKALPFAQFPGGKNPKGGGPTPNQSVVTVRSAGPAVSGERFPSGTLSHRADLRRAHVDRRRTIVFGEMETGEGNTDFTLNNMVFDPDRVDVTMKLGSVEQWTLVNTNTEWHTFHIHVNDFQVISVNGKPVPYVDYQDNVALPPKSRTVIRQRPEDFTGKFVFHCHVLFHEDHGMMAVVQVLRHPTPGQLAAGTATSGAFGIASSAYGSAEVPPPPDPGAMSANSAPAAGGAAGAMAGMGGMDTGADSSPPLIRSQAWLLAMAWIVSLLVPVLALGLLAARRREGPIAKLPRALAIVALAGVAITHAIALPEHLADADVHYIALMFCLLILVSCLCAIGLAVARRPTGAWLVAGAASAMAIAGFVVSRTVGLPNMADDIGNWPPAGIVSLVCEAIVVAVSVYAVAVAGVRMPRLAVWTRAPYERLKQIG
jgi:FtsP/CotA-like multicopper oxidase with cupredoxin domain